MAEQQLFYLATNRYSYITASKAVQKWDWGAKTAWKKVGNPVADSKKKVKYNTTSKNHAGAVSGWSAGDGASHFGTVMPRTAQRTVGGVTYTVDCRYRVRGYYLFSRTAALKALLKMLKTSYTKAKPYQYQIQYKDKMAVYDTEYSELKDSTLIIYFGDVYYDQDGQPVQREEKGIPHPQTFEVTYSDVRKNVNTQNANNSESRDNKGNYILSNVRANVASISLAWNGLTPDEGAHVLGVLNPDLSNGNNRPYINAQYLDPESGSVVNKTFFASDRKVVKYPSGLFKEISVTLTEV